jgi:hypothetical protein
VIGSAVWQKLHRRLFLRCQGCGGRFRWSEKTVHYGFYGKPSLYAYHQRCCALWDRSFDQVIIEQDGAQAGKEGRPGEG